jgi:hypothetical protein
MAEGLPRSDESRLEKALKRAALENHPNPGRIGCPTDKNVLRSLAELQIRPSDPVVQHVAECSPCLSEVFEWRTKVKRRRLSRGVSLAVTIIVICIAVFWLKRPPSPQQSQLATIDLRPFTISRGAAVSPTHYPPLSLSRGKLTLKILLPIGAEEGPYEFKLLDDSLQTVRSGKAQALIREYVTTISTVIDTSGLPFGQYSFWLRQPGREWRSYQIQLR